MNLSSRIPIILGTMFCLTCSLKTQQRITMEHESVEATLTTEAVTAAIKHDSKTIQRLIQSQSNINAQDENGNTMLLLALNTNQTYRPNKKQDQVVAMLLKEGADPNIQNKSGHTTLIRAIRNDLIFCVDALLAANVCVNAQDSYGYTPLMTAINSGGHAREHIVQALLKADADPNIRRFCDWTALMDAATHSTKEIIIGLLNAGANPHIKSNPEIIRKYYLNLDYTEATITQQIADRADKTFFSLLERYQSDLVRDLELQAAIKNYNERFAQYKQDVASEIETNIAPMHFPPVLANIVVEYAVDAAPAKKDPTTSSWFSWCTVQ
jgi:hypothetical protein